MVRKGSPEQPRQLDLFKDMNEKLLHEIKRMKLDGMTPLEALQYLAEVKTRIL